MILHVIKKEDWEKVKGEVLFGGQDIERDGFLHCATKENLYRVLPIFDPREAYVVLHIDETGLDVRYEAYGDTQYPHVFEPIPRCAIVHVEPLQFELWTNKK